MEPVLLYLLGIAIVVIGLVVSIGLHEIGHLVPAKFFGVKVGQYMIGFGRTLWSRRVGETEYGFKAIPLGGYISMAGMFPPRRPGGSGRDASTGFVQTLMQEAPEGGTGETRPEDESRTFYRLAPWKRSIIIFGGPFMNLALAVLLFAIVFVGFGVAQPSTTIGSVSECVVPATSERTECVAGDPAAPAAEAGVQPGDRFVSIAGEPVDQWDDATAVIRESPGETLPLVVERDGELVDLEITPLLTERLVLDGAGAPLLDSAGEPVVEEVGFVGIGAAWQTAPQSPATVVPAVSENVHAVVGIIANLPQRLVDVWNAAFGTEERDPNGPISVVGVGRLAGEIASIDTVPVAERAATLIGLIGSLNVALFVFNLIPLLPLDGGHIAGAAWESIRRRIAKLAGRRDPGPVDVGRLIPLTLTVVVLLGGMSLLLIYADLVKPISLFN